MHCPDRFLKEDLETTHIANEDGVVPKVATYNYMRLIKEHLPNYIRLIKEHLPSYSVVMTSEGRTSR